MNIDLPTADDPVRVVCGDALEVLPRLPAGCVGAVITDPPYGMDWDTDSRRFTGGKGYHHKASARVAGDDRPFDPAPWLAFPRVVLWGANHFAAALPVGTTLVWLKKSADKFGAFLSDAEIAWQSDGHGVYAFWHVWDGCARQSENGEHHHPTQKPVARMRWCIRRLKLAPNSLILDPFGGSGTTAVAAVHEGRRCLIVEKDAGYCDIIRRRVDQALCRGAGNLFADVRQGELFGDDGEAA